MGWLRGWRPGLRARRQGPARAPPHAHPPPPTGHAHPQGCVFWCLAGGARPAKASDTKQRKRLFCTFSSRLRPFSLSAAASPGSGWCGWGPLPLPCPAALASGCLFLSVLPGSDEQPPGKSNKATCGLGQARAHPNTPRNPRQPPCFSSPLAGGPGGGVSGHVCGVRGSRGAVCGAPRVPLRGRLFGWLAHSAGDRMGGSLLVGPAVLWVCRDPAPSEQNTSSLATSLFSAVVVPSFRLLCRPSRRLRARGLSHQGQGVSGGGRTGRPSPPRLCPLAPAAPGALLLPALLPLRVPRCLGPRASVAS